MSRDCWRSAAAPLSRTRSTIGWFGRLPTERPSSQTSRYAAPTFWRASRRARNTGYFPICRSTSPPTPLRSLRVIRTLPPTPHLIVQREAAARFTGGPFGKECLVSLLLKPWWSLEVLAEVPRTVFSPEPRVEAVLLRVKRRKQSLISRSDRKRFEDFIAFAYSGPGPTLRDNLSAVLRRAQFNRLAKSFGLHGRATPGQLTFEQWCGLFEFFSSAVSGSRRRVVEGSARAPRRRRFGVVGRSRKK